MRLSAREISAENCPTDVFVYDKKKKMFFFVDDIDYTDDHTILIHEPSADPSTWVYKELLNDTKLVVVDGYKINDKILYL